MYKLKYSNKFKKDLKKIHKKNSLILVAVRRVLDILVSGCQLDSKYYNHKLKGEFKNCYECHIKSDVLLIYQKDKKCLLILLLRVGSHARLF